MAPTECFGFRVYDGGWGLGSCMQQMVGGYLGSVIPVPRLGPSADPTPLPKSVLWSPPLIGEAMGYGHGIEDCVGYGFPTVGRGS
ncbi:hypothetical protein V6N13_082523 [Hibiscus sabdariffa]